MYNNLKVFWFYQCYHCGMWHYSDQRVKRKTCTRCHRSFTFENAHKIHCQCTTKQAVVIIKQLKKQETEEHQQGGNHSNVTRL
ncbi:MAG: hypothetical protein ACOC4M_07370 [Promethearchaeia archaeon]